MEVTDLRDNRKEANAHTEILEEKVKSAQERKWLSKMRSVGSGAYGFLQITAAGYLAGYVVSGGDMDAATQSAEYASVLWAGIQVGLYLPLKGLLSLTKNGIKDGITGEAHLAQTRREQGRFHAYKPKFGLDYSKQTGNPDRMLHNRIQSEYWHSVVAASKPIRRALSNMTVGALGLLVASAVVDLEVNVIDWVGPNLIEKGLEGAHYLYGQVEPLQGYLPEAVHQHEGDFSQWEMMQLGAAGGFLTTAKRFITGNYRRLRAKIRSSD